MRRDRGIDGGTHRARAGRFDGEERLVATASEVFAMGQAVTDHVEQF
jgi:ribulose kinase